jgi:hypothetical protein
MQANYIIPADFTLDKVKYGAQSGTSYEQRAISAFRFGLLPLMAGGRSGVRVCSGCGHEGHWPADCPNAFDR